MFTPSTAVAILVAALSIGFIIYANVTIFDRKDLPTLQKIMVGFDVFVFVGCFILITVNGWWC